MIIGVCFFICFYRK